MNFLCDNGVSSPASDAIIIVFLALLTIATIFAAVVFLCKYAENNDDVVHKKTTLFVILAAGFVVRLIFAMCLRGYREDYNLFANVFSHLSGNGLSGYYTGDTDAVLYPVVYFIYLVFAGFSNATGISDFTMGVQLMIKLPLIMADLFAAYAVYKIACRYFNRRVAYVLCALICVCPIFFVGSAIWTSPLIFVAMFACFAFYFMARKNFMAMIACATAAAFSGKEGIFLAPVFLIFSMFHFVRAVINIRKNSPRGKALTTPDYNAVYAVPVGYVLSMLVAYLIGLFMIASYNFNYFTYFYEFLLAPLGSWKYFSYNSLGIYSMFNMSGETASARFPTGLFAAIFAIIVTAVVCIVYFSKRNRATMAMLGAYVMFTLQVYFPGATAASMECALVLLLAAYALVKDKRLLRVLALVGLVFVINSGSVLASAGYLNNLENYVFDQSSYTGTTLLSGDLRAIPIVCAAVTVVAHLYLTISVVSIGMTGQKKLLAPCTSMGESIKDFFISKKVD